MDAREFMILFGSTEMCLAADSSINDPMPIDNPIAGATSDMPWTYMHCNVCSSFRAANCAGMGCPLPQLTVAKDEQENWSPKPISREVMD
jgi:hypothetical protein